MSSPLTLIIVEDIPRLYRNFDYIVFFFASLTTYIHYKKKSIFIRTKFVCKVLNLYVIE